MTYFLRKPKEKSRKVHVTDCSYCNCRFCRAIRRQKTTCDSFTKVPVAVLKRYNYCLWFFKYRQRYNIHMSGNFRLKGINIDIASSIFPQIRRQRNVTCMFVQALLFAVRQQRKYQILNHWQPSQIKKRFFNKKKNAI